MKKIMLASAVVVAFILYVVFQRQDGTTNSASSQSTSSQKTTTNASSSTASPSTSKTTTTALTYKDGQYTGTAADAVYGSIQVQATITGGKLTDVVFLQYPNDQRNSIEINTQAMPLLKQEAISAQNAQVDGVTGATDTSQAFTQSLGSALQSAHI